MKRIPLDIVQCIVIGLTLRDYAVVHALVCNRETPMSRQDIEEATGLDKSVIERSTKRLVGLKILSRDKAHPIGGSIHRAAKYLLT